MWINILNNKPYPQSISYYAILAYDGIGEPVGFLSTDILYPLLPCLQNSDFVPEGLIPGWPKSILVFLCLLLLISLCMSLFTTQSLPLGPEFKSTGEHWGTVFSLKEELLGRKRVFSVSQICCLRICPQLQQSSYHQDGQAQG